MLDSKKKEAAHKEQIKDLELVYEMMEQDKYKSHRQLEILEKREIAKEYSSLSTIRNKLLTKKTRLPDPQFIR